MLRTVEVLRGSSYKRASYHVGTKEGPSRTRCLPNKYQGMGLMNMLRTMKVQRKDRHEHVSYHIRYENYDSIKLVKL